MNWKDDQDLGPWAFNKQSDKFGYQNNPRFTQDPDDPNKHHPCGYWYSDPAASKGYFFGEDNVGSRAESIRTYEPNPGWPNSKAARNAFVSNLKNYGWESFEGFEDGEGSPSLTLPFGGYSNTNMVGGNVIAMSAQPVYFGSTLAGRHPLHGDRFFEAGQSWVLTFPEPMNAFGMYMIDLGDFGAEIDLVMTYTDGSMESILLPLHYQIFGSQDNPGGWISFVGVYDTLKSFSAVNMNISVSGADLFGFDSLLLAREGDINLERPIEQLVWPASETALIPVFTASTTETESANYRIIATASDFKHPDDIYDQVRMYFVRQDVTSKELKIAGLSIGLRDESTLNFAETPTRIKFNSVNDLTIVDGIAPFHGLTRMSDWVNFTIDKTKDYLIHIFVEHTGADLVKPYTTYAPWDLETHRKASGVDETMVQSVTGYGVIANCTYLSEMQVRNSSLYQY